MVVCFEREGETIGRRGGSTALETWKRYWLVRVVGGSPGSWLGLFNPCAAEEEAAGSAGGRGREGAGRVAGRASRR